MHKEPHQAPGRRILVIVGNDRNDQGVMALARAALRGAISAGCYGNVRFLPEIIPDVLTRCGSCDGESPCRIRDGLYDFIQRNVLRADGIIFCSRLYWHGYSKCMEAFLDRSVCYHRFEGARAGQSNRRRRRTPMAMSLLLEEASSTCLNDLDYKMMDYARNMGGVLNGITVSNASSGLPGMERDHSAALRGVEGMARELLFYDPRHFDMRCIDCPPVDTDPRHTFGAWGSLTDIH